MGDDVKTVSELHEQYLKFLDIITVSTGNTAGLGCVVEHTGGCSCFRAFGVGRTSFLASEPRLSQFTWSVIAPAHAQSMDRVNGEGLDSEATVSLPP